MKRGRTSEFVELSKAEEELIDYATAGDWFIREGWNRYGEDWPNHVPNNINAAMSYFFHLVLLPKQLEAYYCPIDDVMIHGGRYSGKTVALACCNALWVALNPGNDWLHASPSLEQAALSFRAILQFGEAGAFMDTFVRHYREAPAPTLFYKKWDENDPGSEAQFRSIGQNPMELLRSFEAGRVTADEAFRTQTTDGPYRILAGMLRGPNTYVLNSQPELKDKYDDLAMDVAVETDPERRKDLQLKMDGFAERYGLSKDTRMMLFGNVGAYTWEWQRFEFGQKHPRQRWSVTWTSDDNPYVTEKQRALLKRQYRDDPDGLSVEMRATKPIAVGDVFTGEHMRNLFDGGLEEEAIQRALAGAAGWNWAMHEDFGLVHYARPRETYVVDRTERQAVYAAGADPGTGRVPKRNKWVNMVVRIEPRPFEISYMKCGNLRRRDQGSIEPWIADAKWILKNYPMPEGHFAAEAGGPQKNVHQVVWPENLSIVPLNMNSMKAQLVMQAQLMLRRGMFTSPNIGMLERELLGYQLNDRKLDQDFVVAFLAAVYVVWPYVADEFELVEQDEEEDDYWDFEMFTREVRDTGREVRYR
jgi:hypothetical protein